MPQIQPGQGTPLDGDPPSSRPQPYQSFSGVVVPVFAELASGMAGGDFLVEERLRFERCVTGSGEVPNSARLAVRLNDAQGATPRFSISEALGRYYADRLVRLVRRANAAEPGGEYFFQGVIDGPLEFGFSLNAEFVSLKAQGLLSALSAQRGAQVIGRYMRSRADREADQIDYDDWDVAQGVLYSQVNGVPCVFNAGDKPNCDRVLTMQQVNYQGGSTTVYVPVFADDDDQYAVAWTPAKALMYLAYFYLHFSPLDCLPIFEWLMTSSPQLDTTLVQAWPIEQGAEINPLSAEGTMCPGLAEFGAEGLNMYEALIGLASLAGFRFCERTRTSNDQALTQLYGWVPGTGLLKDLNLEPAGTAVPTMPSLRERWLRYDNNVNIASAMRDLGSVINDPIVVGDVECVETRVLLLPGWLPNEPIRHGEGEQEGEVDEALEAAANTARCDNCYELPPTDYPDAVRKAALEAVEEVSNAISDETLLTTHPFLRNFHARGEYFWWNWNHHVGRLFVANEDQSRDAEQYGRDHGWYNAGVYATPGLEEDGFAWEPGTAEIIAIPGMHVLRKRVPRPLRIDNPLGDVSQINTLSYMILELQLTAGGPWMRIEQGEWRPLRDRLGIRFADRVLLTAVTGMGRDPSDGPLLAYYRQPTTVPPLEDPWDPENPPVPYPGAANLWAALIEGTARLRLTCLVPTDSRIISAPLQLAGTSGTTVRRSRIFLRPGLRKTSYHGVTPIDMVDMPPRDDSLRANDEAVAIGRGHRDARFPASISVPWFDGDYEHGDQISGIPARDISFQSWVGHLSSQYPEVVGVIRETSEEGEHTTYVLNDWRRFPELMPEGVA